ncbi:Helix-turn-helix domain-containing protein [Paenibacillus sp. UNCCL117]|uniref:helix-turn-helix domain-containing protein n=1 Tax=unclassified Paenibacillus TaxID=185978 RepID=UPI000880606C|nr:MULTISPECIES: AraC family transcriptional regulator [unclassified Paenibacillus]SDD40071.1 Helix-turn-helix domain-containing protein [Paenibacillus sp. cl123]SFW48204.1 Helix-turn-helix domain-containing protein [Paenibacillus sp. UNCCL117]
MKKTWFYRLLFSYFPIFFSLTSILVLVTFLLLSEMSQRETANGNQQLVRHLMQLIDYSLKETDSALIKELETDEKLRGFFQGEGAISYFDTYEISKRIHQMGGPDSLIDSIYLYRYADNMVLSTNTFMPLERFGDREFAAGRADRGMLYELSGPRTYMEFQDQERYPASVVSMVRKYPLLQGGQGLVVVNISLAKIGKRLEELTGPGSFVEIRDAGGAVIAGPGGTGEKLPGSTLSRLSSDYTGWSYTGGVHDDNVFKYVSLFSYVWIAASLIVVIVGTVWMTYVTRRNYKPIEEIMDRIQLYSQSRSSKLSRKGQDEFKFIEQALDSLIDQSNTYQKMHEEDSIYRRRHFFTELLEGNRAIDREEWERETKRFDQPGAFRTLAVAIYEIDKYPAVQSSYSQRDLYLLKFVLNSVVKELAETHRVTVWTEWTAQHQLTALYQNAREADEAEDALLRVTGEAQAWVKDNLEFTVTVGLGSAVDDTLQVPETYVQARQALDFKASAGPNRVISYRDAQSGNGELYRQLPLIRSFARAFRTGDENWREMFQSVFREVRVQRLPREELVQVLGTFIDHLYREMVELPPDMQDVWKNEIVGKLNELRDTFDWSGEMESRFAAILEEFSGRLREQQESRSHYKLICEVKDYIDREYANPDLSLNQLCEKFGMNGKYVSRLFKETFGEKLVDYLVGVRIAQSRRLLEETSLSLKQIAAEVGYLHDISYIRAFKKVMGTTPGDYRKSYEKSVL